jgi:dihydroxyacid dehydratase/phosphogluconate dehydratase
MIANPGFIDLDDLAHRFLVTHRLLLHSRRSRQSGDAGFSLFLRKAFIKAMGYSDDALDRPIIGITDTFSGYNACHGNVPQLIEAVKRGVMLAGGLPMSSRRSRSTRASPIRPACICAT